MLCIKFRKNSQDKDIVLSWVLLSPTLVPTKQQQQAVKTNIFVEEYFIPQSAIFFWCEDLVNMDTAKYQI